jgi:hypothetical protein
MSSRATIAGATFNPAVFKLYDAWSVDRGSNDGGRTDARRAVARGG